MKCRLTNYPLSKNLVYVALQMHRSMYLDEEFYLDDDEHHSAIAEPNCFVRFPFYFHLLFSIFLNLFLKLGVKKLNHFFSCPDLGKTSPYSII